MRSGGHVEMAKFGTTALFTLSQVKDIVGWGVAVWIQSIFLWSGARIFSVGLFWGNLLGLSFYWSQLHWKWIRLDPQTYFVETAPVFLTISHIVTLNIFVLLISMFFLWFPIRLVIRKQSRKNLLKD